MSSSSLRTTSCDTGIALILQVRKSRLSKAELSKSHRLSKARSGHPGILSVFLDSFADLRHPSEQLLNHVLNVFHMQISADSEFNLSRPCPSLTTSG